MFSFQIKNKQVGITENDILKALGKVEEPDLKKDLVTLGMIKDISIDGNNVSFTVLLTTPACPLKELIKQRCLDAIHAELGKNIDVSIKMHAEVTSIRNANPQLPGVKNIIAISSGKGGVGKSTVTANLAIALKESGAKVGILDADIYGPSIPLMFGAEDLQPLISNQDGKNKISPIHQYGIKMISIGFLTPADSAVVWRGPMASQALRQFLGDVDWGDLDYLLIDLPPGTSDIHLSLVQTVPVTGAVVVTTPQKVALADASKGMAMFRQPQINVPILGIVENMAYFTPLELPANKYYLFGEGGGKQMAEKSGVPFLGEIPLVQGIREGGDSGRPATMEKNNIISEIFDQVASALAQQVAIRNANSPETERVVVS